jgi:hypothetical protein
MKFSDLKSIIKEILKDEDINFEKKHSQVINYEFNIQENIYNFVGQLYDINNKIVLSVHFKLKNGKNDGMGIDGNKQKFLVFQKVVSLIRSICKKENPYYITFEAREKSRQNLYIKIIDYIIKKHNFPYKMLHTNPITGDENDESEFWLEKTQ